MSSGDIIGQIFSDDYYADPTVVGRVAEVFGRSPDTKAVYGIQNYLDRATGEVLFRWGRESEPSESKTRMYIPYPTLFVRREVYDKIGLIRKDYRCAMDFELALRLTKFTRPYFLDYTIANMRDMGLSGKNYFTAFKEDIRALWEHKYYFSALALIPRKAIVGILMKLKMKRLIYSIWAKNVTPKDTGSSKTPDDTE